MSYIQVNYTRECHEDYRSPEEWGEWRTSYSTYVHSFSVVSEKSYRDLAVEFTPVEEKPYYLVWVEYSSGDSFGNSSGEIQFIHLFENYEAAKACEKVVRENAESKDYNYSFTYKNDSGQEIPEHAAWQGYFERLEHVHIETIEKI